MKKWNTPEIAALDLNATANGFWPWDREVCPLILGGAHDATGCNQPEEQGKGQEANTQDPEDPTNDLS
jgi:hypothetical protein